MDDVFWDYLVTNNFFVLTTLPWRVTVTITLIGKVTSAKLDTVKALLAGL